MNRKKLFAVLAAVSIASASAAPVFADQKTTSVPGAETEAAAAETEVMTEIDQEALLKNIGYKEGNLNKNGWFSEYFGLEYIPGDHQTMGLEENKAIQEYYKRNGEDKMVSSSELVSSIDIDNSIQLMAETNAKSERAEDILKSYMDLEAMEDSSNIADMKLGDMVFKTAAGKVDGEDVTLGVSTDKEGVVLVFKARYDSDVHMKQLFGCFKKLDVKDMEKAGFTPSDTFMTDTESGTEKEQ